MSFLYHGVPRDLVGETLFPLFSLKQAHPAIYENEIKKYDDHPERKKLPFKLLKKLNCSRGDVLHCSPIHPNLIFTALKSVFPEGNRSVKFFKIPISKIADTPAILFDMNRPGYAFGEDEPEDIFDWIDPKKYEEITKVPAEAFEFYQEWKTRGEPGAPAWGKIPHVLVKGPINISDCEVIDWRDPFDKV
ncbi:hypothetical protein K2P97_13070 [bacterium]|nr:hypothetical protein [bacterium]